MRDTHRLIFILLGLLAPTLLAAVKGPYLVTLGDIAAPEAPTSLFAVAGNLSVSLSWSHPNLGDVAEFVVEYRCPSGSGGYIESAPRPTSTNKVVSGLADGVECDFRVAAQDASANQSPWAGPVQATPYSLAFADALCTDSVDCFCDCAMAGGTPGTYANAGCEAAGYTINPTGATIIGCADYDQGAQPPATAGSLDDGTGNAFAALYAGGGSGISDFHCPDGPGSVDGDEGTDADDCYNIVYDSGCDTNAGHSTTDCAFGNRSLGQKFDPGTIYGGHGGLSFAPTYNIGITYLIKYSTNFFARPNFKNDELFNTPFGTEGWPLGQETYLTCDSFLWHECSPDPPGTCFGGDYNDASVNLGCTSSEHNYSTRIFTNCANATYTTFCTGAAHPTDPTIFLCTPADKNCDDTSTTCTAAWVDNATVTKGFLACERDAWGYSARREDFNNPSNPWPNGTWGCWSTKITGVNTTTARVVQKFMGEDGVESTVIDISNIDMSKAEHSFPKTDFQFNNYYNDGYPGSTRAYRYEDNLIITNGEPYPCADAMRPVVGH